MKDKELVKQSISEADAATASSVTVRTDGGSQDVSEDLPLVVLEWNSSRVTEDEGHSSFHSRITNDSGEEIGTLHVWKYIMELDFTIKSESEETRDNIADTLQKHFLMYEGNAEQINSDCYHVEVGNVSPRNIHMVEPDWYQNGLTTDIRYNKFVADTESLEPITSVDETIDVQEDL